MQAEARAQATAARLLREVQSHKSASRRHREKSRECKQQLDELIAACAKRGITITINTQPEGGHSGNPDPQQTITHGQDSPADHAKAEA